MSDVLSKEAPYHIKDYDTKGYYGPGSVLLGPDEWFVSLMEPEDRNWYRDGAGVVTELNRLHIENAALRAELEEMKVAFSIAEQRTADVEAQLEKLEKALEYVAPFMYEQYNDSYGARTFECVDCCARGNGNLPVDARIPHDPGCRVAEIQALTPDTKEAETAGTEELCNDGIPRIPRGGGDERR